MSRLNESKLTVKLIGRLVDVCLENLFLSMIKHLVRSFEISTSGQFDEKIKMDKYEERD